MKTFPQVVKDHLTKVGRSLPKSEVLQARVYSEKYGVDVQVETGEANQPFHVASIGKLFTSVLVGMLQEKNLLNTTDLIVTYLDSSVLDRLFVVDGKDYQSEVTIENLLLHTSGVADYFESTTGAQSSFVDYIIEHPDKIWKPLDLIAVSQQNQHAVSKPGSFHYSDTGYILLGLIIEKVTNLPFHHCLSEYIFNPLDMNDSYLMFDAKPTNGKRPISPIHFNGHEVSTQNLLSCDWAGGGIISTLNDLLIFQKALWNCELVPESYLKEMQEMRGVFRAGMHYGKGMMELHFNEFFFLLRGLPKPKGHSGILATHLYYDSEHDLHIILNFGSNKRMVQSVRSLITIAQLTKRFLK
jgi:D-alanyl-D-alanine carboxypeptidase